MTPSFLTPSQHPVACSMRMAHRLRTNARRAGLSWQEGGNPKPMMRRGPQRTCWWHFRTEASDVSRCLPMERLVYEQAPLELDSLRHFQPVEFYFQNVWNYSEYYKITRRYKFNNIYNESHLECEIMYYENKCFCNEVYICFWAYYQE